jgi:hypothetical protein
VQAVPLGSGLAMWGIPMNLLWSLEELTRWSRHDSTDVRYWALGNLKEHYPRQSGAALAARLGDGDPGIALMAAGHFVDFPDARFADVLLAAFEGAGDPDFRGRCAQALAAIHDGRFAQRYWEDHCFGNHPLRDDSGVLEASMRLRFPAARQWLMHFVAEAAVQRGAPVKGELKEIGARLDAAAEFSLGNRWRKFHFSSLTTCGSITSCLIPLVARWRRCRRLFHRGGL